MGFYGIEKNKLTLNIIQRRASMKQRDGELTCLRDQYCFQVLRDFRMSSLAVNAIQNSCNISRRGVWK